MTLFYKILCGYGPERDVSITADELEKAYGIFLLGGRTIFSGGAVDGKNIQMIVPDWHRMMGWNQEYRLTPEDYKQLRVEGVDDRARNILKDTQVRVQGFISSGKQNLIGTSKQ